MNKDKLFKPAVGQELPALKKIVTQRQVDAYSGVRPKSLHTDSEWAKEKGFKAPLAQALMSTAYISEMMVRYLGEGYIKGGKMSVSFTKPVFVGETLMVRGRIKGRAAEGDKTRVTVDISCENSQGELTLVGVASGIENTCKQ